MENEKNTPEVKLFTKEEVIAFGKKCFYKGYDKAINDDANCFTAWREEAPGLIENENAL